MTKRTILRTALAIAAFAAAACTKTAVSVQPGGSAYISFSTAVSRAAVDDASGISEFGVWLFKDTSPVLAGERVYLSGGSWVYDNLCRWTDGPHLFGAFHPYGLPKNVIDLVLEVDKEQGTADGFQIRYYNGSTGEHDLMTAVYTRTFDSAAPDTSPVPLRFGHLLSRIRVEAVAGSGEVTLNSVEFSGMGVYGTYNYETDDKWVVTRIGEHTPPGSFTVSDLTVAAGTPTPLFKEDLLLIPQDVTSSITLKVKYTSDGETRDRTFTLPEATDWEEGKSYRYTLKFNMEDVSLGVTVADWTVVDTSVEW